MNQEGDLVATQRDSCPECGSGHVETVEAKSFRLAITPDRRCLACGAVWRPPANPWLLLAGGVVLLALGGWKLYGAYSQGASVANIDVMAYPIGIITLMIGVWLTWLSFQGRRQAQAEPTLLRSGAELPSREQQVPGSTRRPTRDQSRARTQRRLGKWGMWLSLGFVLLIIVTGSAPKDKYGRPMKLRGRFLWVEDPNVPMPQQSDPANPSFDHIRKFLEASKRSAGESKTKVTNTPSAAKGGVPNKIAPGPSPSLSGSLPKPDGANETCPPGLSWWELIKTAETPSAHGKEPRIQVPRQPMKPSGRGILVCRKAKENLAVAQPHGAGACIALSPNGSGPIQILDGWPIPRRPRRFRPACGWLCSPWNGFRSQLLLQNRFVDGFIAVRCAQRLDNLWRGLLGKEPYRTVRHDEVGSLTPRRSAKTFRGTVDSESRITIRSRFCPGLEIGGNFPDHQCVCRPVLHIAQRRNPVAFQQASIPRVVTHSVAILIAKYRWDEIRIQKQRNKFPGLGLIVRVVPELTPVNFQIIPRLRQELSGPTLFWLI